MQEFKDNFSKQSAIYARYRPGYPASLFEFLSTQVKEHELAWDCGTGNGQSAISLVHHFKTVYASDPSEQQINNAILHARVTYKTEPAEQTGLEDKTVDLITIAQALHWFDFKKFYGEAKRVLKYDGIIAAWAYGLPVISAGIDKAVKYFHDEVVGEYWQEENRLIEKEYETIPFPFQIISAPSFSIKRLLSSDDLIGHINSWSATQKFIQQKAWNPTAALQDELLKLWGDPKDNKEATWKLILKVGRNNN